MDLNLIVLCGRLATEPELRVFDSGTRFIRYLVITKSGEPRRRLDVIPVTYWDPTDEMITAPLARGARIWICGSVQRRYWEGLEGRRSRIEVVAEQVQVTDLEEFEQVTLPS